MFAALIYRKRARKTNDSSYAQSADEFESLAVQILDRFYQANTRACTKAIIRRIPAYGNVTWLDLAISAEAKQFIAQRAVQDVLNNIWFVNINISTEIFQICDIGLDISINVKLIRPLFSRQLRFGIAVHFVIMMS